MSDLRVLIFLIILLVFLTSCRDNAGMGGVSTGTLPALLNEGLLEKDDVQDENDSEAMTGGINTESEAVSFFETSAETSATTKKVERIVDTDKFAAEIIEIAENNYVTGMSIAVFSGGEIIYTQALGYASKEEEIPASNATKYRSASISKTVTALSAMILYDEGRLDPDATVTSVLGFPCEINPEKPNKIKHLLTHTSTLYDSRAYEIGVEANPPHTLKMVLSNGAFRDTEPGEKYEYSSFGFGVMAAVIESITGDRFYSFAENAVFNKIGIDAGYNRSLIQDTDNIANIYAGGGLSQAVRTWGRTKDYYDKYPLGQQYAAAQCELIISAPDLAKIGIILAGDGTYNGMRVVNEKSLREMKTPFTTVTNDDGTTTSYGYGLIISDNIIEGRTINGHSGNAYGMVGGLYFDSSDNTGVAILTNGCNTAMGDAGVYKINYEIVNAVYSAFFY